MDVPSWMVVRERCTALHPDPDHQVDLSAVSNAHTLTMLLDSYFQPQKVTLHSGSARWQFSLSSHLLLLWRWFAFPFNALIHPFPLVENYKPAMGIKFFKLNYIWNVIYKIKHMADKLVLCVLLEMLNIKHIYLC